jgi:hypothetical protein
VEKLRLGPDEASPTRGIYWVLKPYWKGNTIDDQHWAYVLACLRKIETRCRECRDARELELKHKCLECIERKLIEAI